ncbi:DEAD/DEAH box helicase [Spongiactinospora sp. 9N601]|uniref:DEAD/DEAH box helicase n=1 Tax=Spongiactinospora sp. 9N601 TaxID=3375149 RepID=UPI00379669E6
MAEETFHGLFVGLDQYEMSGRLESLRFAARDATVLHALFQDNLGGEPNLVLNRQATKDRILKEIRHIAAVSTGDDVVAITFSGHGTPTGELATFDANPDKISQTAIPLDAFVAEVDKISARLLIVVLDCCFVGGHLVHGLRRPDSEYGSRAGHVGRVGPDSIDHALSKIVGRGRLVLAASGEGEKAYEGNGLNHGLLTHYIIEGLLGTGDVLVGGRVSLLKLAEHVMMNVASHPRPLAGRVQNPVLQANLGSVFIDVFQKGKRYLEVAQDTKLLPATRALSSLEQHGFPAKVLDIWGKRIQRLTPLQVDAINREALLSGKNVVVTAPTSAGKTLIGEIAAVFTVTQGKKAVFLLPNRALVNEQYDRFVKEYHPAGITTVRATGELRDQVSKLLSGEFDLAVCTYEKFIGLLTMRPDLLSRIGVLVVDEIHCLTLPGRGPHLEMLLTQIRLLRPAGRAPQVIGLSSAIGGCAELAKWLGAGLLESHERPTPLLEGVVRPGGEYRFLRDGDEEQEALPNLQESDDSDLAERLVSELVTANERVLVFRSQRHLAWSFAQHLAGRLGLPPAKSTLDALVGGDDGRATERLRECLRGGVAFHVSDLSDEERRVLENSFRSNNGEIRVLVATTTLAQGVNLPADSVVICELEHPGKGGRPYSVFEYKNMAGRAARTGLTPQGRSFIVARGEVDAAQKWQAYIKARPEALCSALLEGVDDLRSTILSVAGIAKVGLSRSLGVDVQRFLQWSFASYRAKDGDVSHPLAPEKVESALKELCQTQLLCATESGFVLTNLGKVAARSGLRFESADTLAKVLAEVPPDGMNRMTLICAAQFTRELDDARFPTRLNNRLGDLNKLAKELSRQKVAEPVLREMWVNSDEYDSHVARARRSIACLMWSRGIDLAGIERAIAVRTHAGYADVGPVRQAARRTGDIMRAVIEIGQCVNPAADLGALPDLLPAQLELGIAEGLVPIAKWVEVPLRRSVYLNLAREGLDTADRIVDADPGVVRTCVGDDSELMAVVLEAAELALTERTREQVTLSDLVPPPVD